MLLTPLAVGFGDGKWNAEHEDARSYGHAPIVDASGTVVALAVTLGTNDNDALRRDEIIRAVNAHDDLVNALTEIADLTKRQQLPLTAQIHELASAALTKAAS